ncbi:hypothetical protein FZC84_12585 [Rossellomorea vietnamensis]|uniref:Uncharacterized protein n=1 Tax=Rossellomorea vietnamensis TaxID=218284 RepID=A0A5D4MBQ1_9BACI|nr:hypothetical protein [Rossellomorea vietnamensis]TYR98857.1 hypothetical protein FZC84_12585 [Rossellomorea vietnamensis]
MKQDHLERERKENDEKVSFISRASGYMTEFEFLQATKIILLAVQQDRIGIQELEETYIHQQAWKQHVDVLVEANILKQLRPSVYYRYKTPLITSIKIQDM